LNQGAGSGDVGAVHNDCNALFNSAAVSIIERSMKDWTGLLFRLEDSSLCKMRWERSNQVLLNPNQGSLTASALLSWKGNFEHFLPPNFAQKPADYAEIIQNAKKTPLVVANTSEPNFKGKVVVVTGAASGLGRCYATAFAKRDALVVANDIADLSPLLEEITSIGAKAVGCQASCEDGTQVINAALSAFGRIDILINNAGFLRDKSFQNMSEEQWDAVIRNHLNGTYQMTKAAWPHFVQQGKGVIVNTASTSGMFGHFGQANYSTAVSLKPKTT
jgi:multifunctional beta-oxidation protein